MTQTRSSERASGEAHVLNFFYDDDGGCALTTLVRGFRFHIIADQERLQPKSIAGKSIVQQYKALLTAVRDETEKVADPGEYQKRKDLEAAEVHGSFETQDSGHGSDGENGLASESDDDSAVDVQGQTDDSHSEFVLSKEDQANPEKALYNWMLQPFADIFADLPSASGSENQSLHEWYTGPTYFYSLDITSDELVATEEEASQDLNNRIIELVPKITIPKYIRELDIPRYDSHETIVVSESDEPEPYHPSRVRVGDEVHFFKVVDSTQPQPTKRELKIMKEIEQKGLHKTIRVPLVTGLITHQHSQTEIMGFLQTDIEEPTPLTKMLDSDVVEDKRTQWAEETKRVVKVLHDNGIVWGDAKADNFMVDKHGKLWIIDFGGSYTEGWVDPDLTETAEGDDMGTERIVSALQDPDANTYEPDEEDEEASPSPSPKEEQKHSQKKRQRSVGSDEDEDVAETKRKRGS